MKSHTWLLGLVAICVSAGAMGHEPDPSPAPSTAPPAPSSASCLPGDLKDCVVESVGDCGFLEGYSIGLTGALTSWVWAVSAWQTTIALGASACVLPGIVGCLIGCQGTPIQCDVPWGSGGCYESCPSNTIATGEECVITPGQPSVTGTCCMMVPHEP